jgi:hypothetical protein
VQPLKDAKIQRTSFVAVGLALAQFGDYRTGTRVNPSAKALHNLTGAHHDTIRKVLKVLKVNGALEVVDSHQGANGGQPYEVYRFRKSPAVVKVLAKRDAQGWTERASAAGEPASATGEPGHVTGEPASAAGEDNRNISNEMNEKNRSVDESPSPAPVVAQPSARDGAVNQKVEMNDLDKWLMELTEGL